MITRIVPLALLLLLALALATTALAQPPEPATVCVASAETAASGGWRPVTPAPQPCRAYLPLVAP